MSREIATSNTPHLILEKVYEELRRLASANIFRESEPQTLQATALVHEAWLRLGGENGQWNNTSHFFAAAAQAMRRILIERARRNARIKRGGDRIRVDLELLDLREATVDERILLVDEALGMLKEHDAAKAQIVELKFFAGLTNAEVAEMLGTTERTIERHWAFSKAWLFTKIEDLNPRRYVASADDTTH
jgi:RNA polymerase sigma factor (TIGR02999 family)